MGLPAFLRHGLKGHVIRLESGTSCPDLFSSRRLVRRMNDSFIKT